MNARVVITVLAGLVSSVIGATLEGRTGDPLAKVQKAESQLTEAFKARPMGVLDKLAAKELPDGFVLVDVPEWTEVVKISDTLLYSNARILKAKALVKYEETRFPEKATDGGAYNFEWNERDEQSSKPWHIQEDRDFYKTAAKMGAAGGVGGAILAYLLLWSLAWAWQFFLARLREISSAVRGE